MSVNTPTDVWNLALTELGVRTVASIETASATSKEEKLGNLLYQPTLDVLLRAHPFGFAEKEVALSLVTGATSIRFDLVYAHPADCLKITKLTQDGAGGESFPYRVRTDAAKNSKEILSDAEDAYLIYTTNITNVTLFDPDFRDALVYLLASKSAIALKGDSQLKADNYALYLESWALATKDDSDEEESNEPDEEAAITARNG